MQPQEKRFLWGSGRAVVALFLIIISGALARPARPLTHGSAKGERAAPRRSKRRCAVIRRRASTLHLSGLAVKVPSGHPSVLARPA